MATPFYQRRRNMLHFESRSPNISKPIDPRPFTSNSADFSFEDNNPLKYLRKWHPGTTTTAYHVRQASHQNNRRSSSRSDIVSEILAAARDLALHTTQPTPYYLSSNRLTRILSHSTDSHTFPSRNKYATTPLPSTSTFFLDVIR